MPPEARHFVLLHYGICPKKISTRWYNIKEFVIKICPYNHSI